MKIPIKYIFISLFFLGSSCKKNKNLNPIDQLPLATQTGANTFGCLINGKTFIPKGNPFTGPILHCAYQYLDDIYDKGFFFQLYASDLSDNNNIVNIGIFTDGLKIHVGNFILADTMRGQAIGKYDYIGNQEQYYLYTSKTLPGQLNITKFDTLKQIVSGTFFFSVIKNVNDTIKVTDGRFDLKYTL